MGYARSGKDTAAAGLVRDLGFRRFALADPLKEMALDINPFLACGPLAEFVGEVGWEAAKSVSSVRQFLQRLGTEGIRKYVGDDFWAKLLKGRSANEPRIVVTDVRFANELFLLRTDAAHTLTIWVQRDGCEAGDHPSEKSLCPQDADYIVCNRGDIPLLQSQVVSLARDYFGIH